MSCKLESPQNESGKYVDSTADNNGRFSLLSRKKERWLVGSLSVFS